MISIKNFLSRHITIILTILSLLVFLCFSIYVYNTTTISQRPGETTVHFINVGEGDCSLIHNNDYNILIDAGPNESKNKVVLYLKKLHIKKLDYVIATHPHEDHIGGMETIINNFSIGTFIAPYVTVDSSDFQNMVRALRNNNLSITTANNNQFIKLNDKDYLEIIYGGFLGNSDNLNNYSIVSKFISGDSSFIFTGDAEEEVEAFLVSNIPNLDSDVLKTGHHGSSTSSIPSFIGRVSPIISIISCGIGNDYGHPSSETLETLKKSNSKVFRTDINGTIVLKTDGKTISVMCQRQDY